MVKEIGRQRFRVAIFLLEALAPQYPGLSELHRHGHSRASIANTLKTSIQAKC